MTTIINNYPISKILLSSFNRLQQTYIIGANGVGKSTTLLKLILRDIGNGYGVCVLDPHGDLIKDVISCMAARIDDVVLLSLTNPDLPFGLNLFHCDNPHDPLAVQNTVSTILNIFEKVYGVDRNTMARVINYLQALVYLFIHNSDLTVLDIPKILDPSKESEMLRLRLVQNLPAALAYDYTRYFWTTYYNNRGYFGRDEELAGVFNKFREMSSVLLYPVFCQKNTIDFSDMMAQKKIVLCKLNSDWPDVTSLVGSILIAQILHAGYVRKHTAPFFVYADEFQNFATADFARLFAEARKFKIGITISHQTLQQVPEIIKDVVLQNAGTLIVFRIGSKDAKEVAGNFSIVPDPAWEEELEPESVEVLTPVKHERVEEDIIDGEKPVRIPKFNVIDHLLNVGHPNDAVTLFVIKYLQFLQSEANYRLDITNPYGAHLRLEQEELIEHLEYLNNFMHFSMQFQQIPSPDILTKIAEKFADKLGFPYYHNLLASGEQKLIGELSETLIKQQERYEKFYTSLCNMLTALAEQPIEVESGQWEPRIRKQINYLTYPPLNLQKSRRVILHPQREISTIEDELRNGLVSLPNYMACVKTRSGEYLVQTTPPPRGVTEREFRYRVRRIQQQNYTAGYVKRRGEVEELLRKTNNDIPLQEIDTPIYASIPDMKKTDAQKMILQALYRFPYLTALQTCRLLFSPGSIQGVRQHLKELTDQEQVKRAPLYSQNRNPEYIYWLSTKGRNTLRRLGYDFATWQKEPKQMDTFLKSYHFDHYMQTTNFLIEMTLLASMTPTFSVPEIMHYFTLNRIRIASTIPDGWAKVLDGQGNATYFCIEIDMQTEKEEAFQEKIKNILAFIEHNEYQQVYHQGEDEKVTPQWLFYTPHGQQRQDAMLRWIEEQLLKRYQPDKATWFRVACGSPFTVDMFFQDIWYIPNCLHDKRQHVPIFSLS